MTATRIATLGTLLLFSACGKKGSDLPVATFLSPKGVNHLGSRFSPDGSHVAFWTPGEDGWDIVVAKGDLSGARTVSSHNARQWPLVWSPDSKQIVFSSSAFNVADLWIVSADSGAARQLTSAPGYEVPSSWNPHGDRLTYNATTGEGGALRGFFLDLGTGTSSPIPATTGPIARWSPTGTRMTLEGFGNKNTFVWVADSLGNDLKQLTTDGWETDLNWSPDGTEIAYVSRRTGTGDIWVVPAAGGAPRQLTRDIRDDNNPRWSADGKWIAFISQRGQQTDVWVVPSGGGTEIRVTDDEAEEGNLQWVGKELRLAYHTGITGSGMFAVSVADGKERRLTPDSLVIGEIMPSPDGKEVAYEVNRGGGVTDIQVMALPGGAPRVLVANGMANSTPNWSPDGKSVVYLSNRAGTFDIWLVSATGGAPRQLTDFPGPEANAQWSRDGGTIYFTSRKDAGGPFSDLWKVSPTGGPATRITHTGAVNGLAVSLVSADIVVQSEGGKDGRTTLCRVTADGKLETVWDRSNVTGLSWYGYTPTGDSLVINAELPGGGNGSYLISTKTGQGRQILGKGDLAGDFSRDGRWLGYWTGTATLAIAVMDMKDGSTHRLTKSPESDASYWWTADNQTLVFTRQSQRRRIATVDVSRLLKGR